MGLNVVILAAGSGKRMGSSKPKVLHELAGISMLERVFKVAEKLNPEKIFVVYGSNGQQILESMQHLPVTWVMQEKALGTGHALAQVLPHLKKTDSVLVLYGDVPLISEDTLNLLLKDTPKNAVGMVICELENPTGFGRIIRNELGNIIAIVEQRDASVEQTKIKEINTGILLISAAHLKQWLPKIKNKNAQQEYYLTDIIAIAVKAGFSVGGIMAHCPEEVLGVNNLAEIAALERYFLRRVANQLMLGGTRISDPNRFDLRGELTVGKDVFIDNNVILEGKVELGNQVVIGSNNILRDVKIGDNVHIKSHCVLESCVIENNVEIGPFARLRPETMIRSHAKVGNFVEIKKTTLGKNSKANHLSYLGDAVIGEHVNIGAGTITCNYDGANKHETIIEDNAFIGSNTSLIAPVRIHENATIGASSAINSDAPANQLTISRARQRSLNWQRPTKKSKV